MKKRIAVYIVTYVSIFFSLQCVDPVTPGDGPTISEAGKRFARQAVYMLKIVRSVGDVNDVTNQLTFAKTVLDKPSVRVSFWQPDSSTSVFSSSLRKRLAVSSTSMLSSANALFKASAGLSQDFLITDYADSLFDTIVTLNDTPGVWQTGVRTLTDLERGVNFSAGIDSITWYFIATDSLKTNKHFVRLHRMLRSDSLLVTDHQMYNRDSLIWKMTSRDQYRDASVSSKFRHKLAVSGVLLSDTLTTAESGIARSLYINRYDVSSGSWQSLDSSQIRDYLDSTVTADSTSVVQLFDNDIETDGLIVNPQKSSVQLVLATVVKKWSNPAKTEHVSYSEEYNPAGHTVVLTSYSSTQTLSSTNDTTIYRYSGKFMPDSACTFSAHVVAGVDNNDDSTEFGKRLKTTYVYTGKFDAGLNFSTYTSIKRYDTLRISSRYDAAQYASYSFVPKNGSARIDSVGTLPAGTTKIIAQSLQSGLVPCYRIWELQDSTYTYTSVDVNEDSMQLIMTTKAGGNISYKYNKLLLSTRTGVNVTAGGSKTCYDTLRKSGSNGIVRTMSTAFTGPQTGTIIIGGLDSTVVNVTADSLIVAYTNRTDLMPLSCVIRRANGQYTTSFTDPLSGKFFVDTLNVSFDNHITAKLISPVIYTDNTMSVKSMYGKNLTILPNNISAGSTLFYGVLVDAADEITGVQLGIDLWGTNRLEAYNFE